MLSKIGKILEELMLRSSAQVVVIHLEPMHSMKAVLGKDADGKGIEFKLELDPCQGQQPWLNFA